MKTITKGDTVKLDLGGHPEGPYSVTSIVKHKDGRELANIKKGGRRYSVFTTFLKKVKK